MMEIQPIQYWLFEGFFDEVVIAEQSVRPEIEDGDFEMLRKFLVE